MPTFSLFLPCLKDGSQQYFTQLSIHMCHYGANFQAIQIRRMSHTIQTPPAVLSKRQRHENTDWFFSTTAHYNCSFQRRADKAPMLCLTSLKPWANSLNQAWSLSSWRHKKGLECIDESMAFDVTAQKWADFHSSPTEIRQWPFKSLRPQNIIAVSQKLAITLS